MPGEGMSNWDGRAQNPRHPWPENRSGIFGAGGSWNRFEIEGSFDFQSSCEVPFQVCGMSQGASDVAGIRNAKPPRTETAGGGHRGGLNGRIEQQVVPAWLSPGKVPV